MTRFEAYHILTKYLKNPNLLKHCLATEAAMKGLAKHFGEDEEMWGIVGLLHDADYELAKDDLSKHGLLLFEKEFQIPEDIAYAIKSHNFEGTKVMPKNPMDWAVTCVDQLTGLIIAAALVHPEKKLSVLTVDTILKRFKEKSFARGAKRETIGLCEEKLHIQLRDFVTITLDSMKGIHTELGL